MCLCEPDARNDLRHRKRLGPIPEKWRRIAVLDSITSVPSTPPHGEANMEIRNQSKTGPCVPPLAEIAATLSHQIDDMKQRLLDRLSRDPSSWK